MTTACAQNVTSLSGEERRRVQTLSWLLSLSFLLPGVRLHSVVSTGWRIRLILGLLSSLHTNKGIQNSFYFSNTKMLCYKMFNKSNKDKREKRQSQYLWLIFQGFLILSSPETTPPKPPRGFLHLQTRGLPRYRGHQAKDLQTDAETQQGHTKGPSVGKIQPWYLTYCEVLCY